MKRVRLAVALFAGVDDDDTTAATREHQRCGKTCRSTADDRDIDLFELRHGSLERIPRATRWSLAQQILHDVALLLQLGDRCVDLGARESVELHALHDLVATIAFGAQRE